jgi:thiol:disulfide interchange protein DsbD
MGLNMMRSNSMGLLLLLCLGLAGGTAPAQAADAATAIVPAAHKADDFLEPDVAFQLAARVAAPGKVALDWAIAPGYYLYQQRLKFAASTPGVTLGKPELPAGDTKHDEYFGEQIVYHRELHAVLPFAGAAAGSIDIAVTYQGCAEKGLCYPPITKKFTLALPKAAAAAGFGAPGGGGGSGASGYVSEQDRLLRSFLGDNIFLMLVKAFIGGLLLSFTPCMWPMVPILSGLIVGQKQAVSTPRAFVLSLSYVLGMAVTYSVAGAAFALAGKQAQAVFQQPWIIVVFAALFVALALSMFGLYTLQMPAAIQTRLTDASNRQQSGTLGGVAVMGALSSLIVSACVGPVLVAALTIISQTGDVVRGASALFAMSLGMGAPLLLVGTSAGRYLPRAGVWMDAVKQLFGALMLGVAAWMLARLVGDRWSLLLYAVPLLAAAIVLVRVQARSGGARLGARVAAAAGLLGALVLVVGASRGATDPLHPLANPAAAQASAAVFEPIHSVAELDAVVAQATAAGQPVMLDFYADWCTSCKEMERYTFSDPAVRSRLGGLRLLRADVTANNDDDQALLKRFGIFGPPTIAFYDRAGQEQPAYRVVGYMKAAEFAALLQRLAGA